MLGEKHTQINAEVSDAVGEMTNMIYGSAKTTLNQLGYNFEMAIPTVISGDFKISHANKGRHVGYSFQSDEWIHFLRGDNGPINMATSSGRTVDVLIGSPRDSFWDAVKAILKGYYPYQLNHFRSIDQILESNPENFKPILALIDGQDGTATTNEWVQSTKMKHPDCRVIVLHSAAAALDFNTVKKNGADEMMHINFDREFISDMVLQIAPSRSKANAFPSQP